MGSRPWPATCFAGGVDRTSEQLEDVSAGSEWFALGRSELLDAFLDEPDAVALLTD